MTTSIEHPASTRTQPTGALSPATRGALEAIPRRVIASSEPSGWASVLVDHHTIDRTDHDLTIPPTPDLSIKVMLRGGQRLSLRSGAAWRTREYRRGDVAVIASADPQDLQRRALPGHAPIEKVNLYVAGGLVAEVADGLRRAGQRPATIPTWPGVGQDPVVTATARRLATAAANGASELLAQSGAVWLIGHLLDRSGSDVPDRPRESVSAARRRSRVSAARDLMHAEYSRPLTLEDLAAAAHLSRFEFLRMFRDVHGLTPHAYLREVRLQAARGLLRTTDLPVSVIAGRCGFRSASHFSAAYAARFASAPSRDRR